MTAIATVGSTGLKKVAALYAEGRWDACLDLIDSIIQGTPEDRVPVQLLIRKIQVLGSLDRRLEALDVARHTTALHPRDGRLWVTRARLEAQSGGLAWAFHAYKQAYRLGETPDESIRQMFRILMARGCFAAAQRPARDPAISGRDDPSLIAHRAELALVRGEPAACLAVIHAVAQGDRQLPLRLKFYRGVARRLEAELAAGDTMAGTRHIAISGISYVGSTVFGVILGSLPGLAFAGETHWLAHPRGNRADGERASILDPDVKPEEWPTACRVCGRNCEVFSPRVPPRLGPEPDRLVRFDRTKAGRIRSRHLRQESGDVLDA